MGDDGDQDIKRKEAGASEGGDTSKGLLLAAKPTAEAQPAGARAGKEMKEAVASDVGDHDRELNSKVERQPWEEEGGILRLKKEADAAWDLWFLTQSSRRKGREATQEKEKATQEKKTAKAPGEGKKRKKVVKIKLRKEYVDHMAACPFTICADLSDEELAQCTPDFREIYAAGRFLETKNREYWNALIAQQKEFGYAEDETEVTDQEGEEEEMVEN